MNEMPKEISKKIIQFCDDYEENYKINNGILNLKKYQ